MKVPLNWLAQYTKLPKNKALLTDKLTGAGHMLDKIEVVNGETVVDLELRGNRADCYSILGIAREVAALFDSVITYPPIYKKLPESDKLPSCSITVKTPLVRRVVAVQVHDLVLTSSPKWLADALTSYGITSINNIVDLTNFVMIETGTPMHAFDLDKIGKQVTLRMAKQGETLVTFQDKKIRLTTDDLVWANKNEILSIAGAIGGKENSISKNTKQILLEAANYDRANIRRTIHRYNLFTDAGIRHEKELDPNQMDNAIYRFLYLLDKNKWGRINPVIFDYYPKPFKPWKVTLEYDMLNSLAGMQIPPQKVLETLTSLNFKISQKTTKGITVFPPTYRTDVTLPEDIVEEVVRIIGYDEIPQQTLALAIPSNITPTFITQENQVRGVMENLGFDEAITLPFVREKLLNLNFALEEPKVEAAKVQNAPSPDLKEMRLSLLPNLSDVIQKVINERGEEARFFEIGKVYCLKNKKYEEKRFLGITYWSKNNSSFRDFKGYLESFFQKMNISEVIFQVDNNAVNNYFKDSYKVQVSKEQVGVGGRMNDIYYSQVNLDLILDSPHPTKASLWPKYPPQIEDITLILPSNTKLGEVVNVIRNADSVKNVRLVDTYKDAYTFRVWYQHKDKTLTDQEVKKTREKFLSVLSKKFGAVQK